MGAPQQITPARERILAAALLLIAENGYKATTTRQIARQAEVNESTIFKQFGGKGELFLALRESEMVTLEDELGQIFGDNQKNLEAITHQGGNRVYQLFLAHSDFIAILLRELGNHELNLGKNSVFESTANHLIKSLARQTGGEKNLFSAPVFMFVSSIMYLVIDNRHHGTLTDDLQSPVTILSICQLFCASIQTCLAQGGIT